MINEKLFRTLNYWRSRLFRNLYLTVQRLRWRSFTMPEHDHLIDVCILRQKRGVPWPLTLLLAESNILSPPSTGKHSPRTRARGQCIVPARRIVLFLDYHRETMFRSYWTNVDRLPPLTSHQHTHTHTYTYSASNFVFLTRQTRGFSIRNPQFPNTHRVSGENEII